MSDCNIRLHCEAGDGVLTFKRDNFLSGLYQTLFMKRLKGIFIIIHLCSGEIIFKVHI